MVGGSGQIGSALIGAARGAGQVTIGTCFSQKQDGLLPLNICEKPLRSIVPDLGEDDTVYLLAAAGRPTWVHENPVAAHLLNIEASFRLADEVMESGARLVFMSTDNVFNGVEGGYLETAVPQPLHLLGRQKVAMEQHILSANGRGIVTRTSFNVSWNQSVQCPVTQCYSTLLQPHAKMAIDNIIGISDVDDVASGLLRLASDVQPKASIYHLASSPPISRFELAETIQSESRLSAQMHFEPVEFASIVGRYSEPRPTRAFLLSERLQELGATFRHPSAVIRQKTVLLDQLNHHRITK